MGRTLTLDEVDAIRAQPHHAALLYLTDRCPVRCAHCSVNALPRGPRPADPALTERLVSELCAMDRIRLVGISGGEPFGERRLLERVTASLAGAGKQLVLYTSGNWGRDDGTAPGWTRDVLARASCVVLSTDGYHAARIPEPRYLAALRAAAVAGAWVAVQVLGSEAETAEAARLLTAAFGVTWREVAEIRGTPLLPRGRATGKVPQMSVGTVTMATVPTDIRGGAASGGLSPARAAKPGLTSGPCRLLGAPVVRYDGRVTACCNEDVVTGQGPAPLHATAAQPGELRDRLEAMRRDPFLRVMQSTGPAAIARLPRYRGMGGGDICSLCWDLLGHGAGADPAVHVLALIGRPA